MDPGKDQLPDWPGYPNKVYLSIYLLNVCFPKGPRPWVYIVIALNVCFPKEPRYRLWCLSMFASLRQKRINLWLHEPDPVKYFDIQYFFLIVWWGHRGILEILHENYSWCTQSLRSHPHYQGLQQYSKFSTNLSNFCQFTFLY